MFKKFLLLIVCSCVSAPLWAFDILTSIKPIQMITLELTKGVVTPEALLPASASPHDYALRPSDVRKIKQADLVIWFGDGLEPFMASLIEGKPNVVTISQLKDLPLQKFTTDAHDEDGDEHEHEHEHHHHHGMINPHFWLGIDAVKGVAKAISHQLIELDAVHADAYSKNLTEFLTQLDATDHEIASQLSPIKDKPYYVFHDAYGYFESHFNLHHQGHFTVSPERKPGAKTIAHIRETLAHYSHVCVFAEPQFKPAIVKTVVSGTDANIGELDPLGTSIEVKAGSYFQFLHQLADHFTQCLMQE